MAAGEPLSAFAARKARQQNAHAGAGQSQLTPDSRNEKSQNIVTEPQRFESTVRPIKKRRIKHDRLDAINSAKTEREAAPAVRTSQGEDSLEAEDQSSGPENAAATKEEVLDSSGDETTSAILSADEELDTSRRLKVLPNKQLSTFTPSSSNYVDHDQGSVRITLSDGDTLTFIGQYDVWVRKGTISIMGAVLHASPKLHRIYAPSTHSLPAIKHMRNPYGSRDQDAELTVFSCATRIRRLCRNNPKYRKIWNSPSTSSGQSFTFLNYSADDPKTRPLSILDPAKDWQTLVAHLLDKESQDIPRIMLCGPKGAGKSTFARLLANSFLTRKFARNGVGFLDLDPGQPEYSPPGDLSLVHMKNCNLGPPFTHPHIPDGSEDSMIRSHHIGSNSPQNDKIHYQRCAADLLTRYDQHLRPLGAPLIINSCGWIQGVGLEILEELIQAYKLTDVIYMSTTGPEEVIETLQEATTRAGVSFHTLSSQPTDIITRSPADLRLMQTLSYFHLDEPEDGTLRWDPTPLYIWPFERLPYSGTDQTFIGTMFLGEEINLEGYGTIVNGTILSLVLVEDESALPPDVRPSIVGIRPQDGDNVLPGHSNAWAQSGTANDSNGDSEEEDLGPGKPSIRRTKDGFPYFFVGKGANEPLDPSKTRSLGQVYVRSLGIDEKAHRIYSPISWEKIQSYTSKGAALVLVRGNLEVPSWSYLEEYHEAIAAKRDRTRWKKYKEAFDLVDGNGIESDGSVEFDVREWADETPWVVVPEPTGKGERKRDKVWRTRRNLQTNDGRRKA